MMMSYGKSFTPWNEFYKGSFDLSIHLLKIMVNFVVGWPQKVAHAKSNIVWEDKSGEMKRKVERV